MNPTVHNTWLAIDSDSSHGSPRYSVGSLHPPLRGSIYCTARQRCAFSGLVCKATYLQHFVGHGRTFEIMNANYEQVQVPPCNRRDILRTAYRVFPPYIPRRTFANAGRVPVLNQKCDGLLAGREILSSFFTYQVDPPEPLNALARLGTFRVSPSTRFAPHERTMRARPTY